MDKCYYTLNKLLQVSTNNTTFKEYKSPATHIILIRAMYIIYYSNVWITMLDFNENYGAKMFEWKTMKKIRNISCSTNKGIAKETQR